MAHAHDTVSQHSCPACDYGPFARNHYFTGKLLVERDFTDETRFHMEKLRHHEQQLHGWGVVCGLKVKPHPNPACRDRFVCIEPGSAVDCCGHDIIVREEECIDITQLPAIKALQTSSDAGPHKLQICVRFRECPTEEIPVLYDDCGCDDTKCAPNRILESYEIDVMVDPEDEPASFQSPTLTWKNSVAIAHAAHVALHETSHRLYVATADNPGTVYQISTDNHTTVTSRTLPAKIVAQAVSNDGKHLYVVVEPTAPVTLRQLHVLDTLQPGMPDFNTNPINLLNSANSAVELAVMPDGRLLALVVSSGDILRWGTDLDTNPNPAPLTAPTVNVGANIQGLVLSSDGTRAFALGPNNQIQQINGLDTATPTVTAPLNVLSATAKPSAMALVSSTAADMLAVVDQTNLLLYLVALSPGASLVSSVKLDHPPIALVASPGGHWAYVLEQDAAGSFVQSVNLDALKQKLSVLPGKEFKVGNDSRQIVVSDSGTHLYIPYVEDLTKPALGGVAVLEVSEQSCEDIWWRHLDGCPHCDMPDCVVLATIERYHLGDRIEDQTDPPADPQADLTNKVARINNRKGRRLLPSTQVLAEVMKCLLEHGTGAGGMQGPPGLQGPQGEKGDPGTGVTSADAETVLPGQPAEAQFNPLTGHIHFKIPKGNKGDPGTQGGPGLDNVTLQLVACDQPASATIVTQPNGQRVLNLVVPSGCIQAVLTHLCDISWRHGADIPLRVVQEQGLIIAFDRPVQSGDLDHHSLRVLRQRREDGQFSCWCEVLLRIEPGDLQERCNVNSGFTPSANPTVNAVRIRIDGHALQVGEEYRITVSGDLIRDVENKAIDANHLPPWFNTPNYSTGDGVAGGTFESWFTLRQ